MPETAMLPESPVKSHFTFHIVCPDLDSSVQTCVFTHYGPYDVEGIDEVKRSTFKYEFLRSIFSREFVVSAEKTNGHGTVHSLALTTPGLSQQSFDRILV